jgi:hypothetical protein
MTASTMAANFCTSEIVISSCPATEALEQEKRKMMVAREGRASFESKLCQLFNMNLEDQDANSFPLIQWDSDESDSDSDSVRSLDAWNSVLTDFDSSGSLGQRGRSELHGNRRLVRSKQINSDLSSLAMSLTARSA